MKSDKGITLNSLIIYIIGMLIVITLISTLTTFFSKNISTKDMNSNTLQYTKFSSVFLTEINSKGNKVVQCKTTGEGANKVSYIVFSSGNQYTYMGENKSIYKNKIKICEDVTECNFSYDNNMQEITLGFKTDTIDLTGEDSIIYKLQ